MLVEVYCDGSATTADKPGGWANCIVVDGNLFFSQNGGILKATNNVAEIQAAIEGLSYVRTCTNDGTLPGIHDIEIVLVSDSQLVLKYATGEYQCRKMHLVPYYTKLRALYRELNATTRWVKGHQGDFYNEICDKLAKKARESIECQNNALNV